MPLNDRDASAGSGLDTLITQIRRTFVEAEFEHIVIPIVQPAEPFLDRLGEAFRGRIYSFDEPNGVELCLRPDFTIAACLRYLESTGGAKTAAKLCYDGPVFRHGENRDWRQSETHQAGAELIGLPNSMAADVEAIDLALRALRNAGLRQIDVLLGDLALYSAVLNALELPQHWITRLKRHVWRGKDLDSLDQLTAGPPPENTFLALIGSMEPPEARAALRGALELGGIAPLGTRSTNEVVDRLLEQATKASTMQLPRLKAATISAFLTIREPVSKAADAMRRVAKLGGFSIDEAINAWDRRLNLIERQGIDIGGATFAASFGRSMEYYTGFVFELRSQGSIEPVAGGGRYDTLLQTLGAATPIPAIGCAVYGERLASVLAAQDTER